MLSTSFLLQHDSICALEVDKVAAQVGTVISRRERCCYTRPFTPTRYLSDVWSWIVCTGKDHIYVPERGGIATALPLPILSPHHVDLRIETGATMTVIGFP